MLTSEQQLFLYQINSFLNQLEKLFSTQQLEKFHTSWFSLHCPRDIFQDEQHQSSLERQQAFLNSRQHISL